MSGTVPSSPSDPRVVTWLKKFGFANSPVHVRYQPQGYLAAMCHVNAKHAAATLGGRRVHGWAIWLFDIGLSGLPNVVAHAEFHSVVRVDGVLVDVTPPKFGASRVLFLEDPELSITKIDSNYVMYSELSCHPTQTYWNGPKDPGGPRYDMPDTTPPLPDELSRLGMRDML